VIENKKSNRRGAEDAEKGKDGIHHPLGCASLEDTEDAEENQEPDSI
jgi:hypothetical protein